MFTAYAIDRDGKKHGNIECATLDEAMEYFDELHMETALDSEPDNLFIVRYGITFDHDGLSELEDRLKASRPPQAPGAPDATYGARQVWSPHTPQQLKPVSYGGQSEPK